jgi:hypothetical protein
VSVHVSVAAQGGSNSRRCRGWARVSICDPAAAASLMDQAQGTLVSQGPEWTGFLLCPVSVLVARIFTSRMYAKHPGD